MKFSILSVTALLVLAPEALAWKVNFYDKTNYKGTKATWSGPGGTGSHCFTNVDPLNNRISSLQFYSYNAVHKTKCCITLYDSPGCKTKTPDWEPQSTCKDAFVTSIPSGFNNDISSFKTTCHKA